MDQWVEFYERRARLHGAEALHRQGHHHRVLGADEQGDADGDGRVKFPINEPAEGKRKSQIEEYLDSTAGPGVQHIALATDDIVDTVDALRKRGVEFLRARHLLRRSRRRVGEIDEHWRTCAGCGILADRDDEGYLLQIFTKPMQDRPTLFFEVIERHGAGLRRRQLQGALRGDRARAGPARQPLTAR